MARIADLTEVWRSRNCGQSERHENGTVSVPQDCLDGRSGNNFA
jgi:hypothetical protein